MNDTQLSKDILNERKLKKEPKTVPSDIRLIQPNATVQ